MISSPFQARFTRRSSLYGFLASGLFAVVGISSHSLGANKVASEEETPAFRPRRDTSAASDLKALRDQLAKVSDSRGPITPLGNYLQRSEEPSSESERDYEAEQPPRLDRKDTQFQSDTGNGASYFGFRDKGQREKADKIDSLPPPQMTLVKPVSAMSDLYVQNYDSFQPTRFATDAEARVIPQLTSSVPISAWPASYVANYQPYVANYQIGPALPGNNGGIPSNDLPVLPPSGSFGNSPAPILPNPSPTYPAPITTPGSGFPSGGVINPGTTGNPPIISNPIPSSPLPSSPLPSYPTPGNVLPGGSIVPNNPVVPSVTSPIIQNPTTPLPVYPRNSGIVNSAPFVSNPPCQFDARYMVSPAVYRQSMYACNNPCGPTGAAPNAYVPFSNSPFTYVPPTAMPYNYGNNGGFRPLLGFGQNLNNAYLGRGIIGQPTAYVTGQPVRNFLRYIFP